MTAQLLEASCSLAEYSDVPHLTVQNGLVLDVDRTFVRTQDATDLYRELGERTFGLDGRVLEEAQAQIEQDGGSFSPVAYAESTLRRDQFHGLGQAFMEAPEALHYDDAEILFDGIFGDGLVLCLAATYGVNALWQGMKTAKSPFCGYVEIMPHSRKGPRLASWRGPQDTFDFVGVDDAGEPLLVAHAQSLTLVDDKVSSHEDLPPDCDGRLVVRPDVPRLRSQGNPADAPEGVTPIAGLQEIDIDTGFDIAACNVAPRRDWPRPAGFIPIYGAERQRPSGLIVGQTVLFAELYRQTSLLAACYLNAG